jgi:hypothetical protein
MKKILGIMGFAGSGKNTAANALLDTGDWEKIAFADSLKDVLVAIFGWDRTLLEGETNASREWRNTVDLWWSNKLGIVNFTPRLAMTTFGTDLVRKHFNPDTWMHALERKIAKCDKNIIITDCRYHNESTLIQTLGGKLMIIHPKVKPDFWEFSCVVPGHADYAYSRVMLETKFKYIHNSEWEWNNIQVDYTIINDSTIAALHSKIKELIHD